jgi:hypothetical protein
MADNNEPPFGDLPSTKEAFVTGREERAAARRNRPLQQSHNDSLLVNTSLRRSNREQAQDESSRGRSDRRREELNLPSSSFLARSLDKDVLAENRKRRTASTGNLSLREDGDEDLNDDLDHNTDLPTPVAIDFSELAFLLEGTES